MGTFPHLKQAEPTVPKHVVGGRTKKTSPPTIKLSRDRFCPFVYIGRGFFRVATLLRLLVVLWMWIRSRVGTRTTVEKSRNRRNMPKAKKKKPSRHKCVFIFKSLIFQPKAVHYIILSSQPYYKDGWEGKMWYSRPLVKTRWLVSHGCIR